MSLVTSPPTFCWDLDEASGNRVDHYQSHPLTPINTPGITTGKVNNAARFVRASSQRLYDSATVSLPVFNTSAAFGMMFWFRLLTVAGATNTQLISRGNSSAAGQYHFLVMVLTDGTILAIFGSALGAVLTTSSGIVTANIWYFLAIWHDGTTARLQVNNTGTITSHTIGFGTSNPGLPFNFGAIGNTTPAQFLDGDLDQVMLFNRTLDAEDRSQAYNNGNGLACNLGTLAAKVPRHLFHAGVIL
jgi:hypothetical protein